MARASYARAGRGPGPRLEDPHPGGHGHHRVAARAPSPDPGVEGQGLHRRERSGARRSSGGAGARGCGPEVGAIIDAENRDRMMLYRTLLQQNSMPASELAKVQAGFAKARLERARPGDWVQTESGQWTRK